MCQVVWMSEATGQRGTPDEPRDNPEWDEAEEVVVSVRVNGKEICD